MHFKQSVLAGASLAALAASVTAVPAGARTFSCSRSPNLAFVRGSTTLGHGQWDLSLRNTSARTCTLRGFAGVQLLGQHNKKLRVRVKHSGRSPVRTVALAPGKRAFFTVTFPTGTACGRRVYKAYGLLVRWAGYTAGLETRPSGVTICDPSVGGNPTVTAFRARLNFG
jgi:hypothetical protein